MPRVCERNVKLSQTPQPLYEPRACGAVRHLCSSASREAEAFLLRQLTGGVSGCVDKFVFPSFCHYRWWSGRGGGFCCHNGTAVAAQTDNER